MAGGVAQGVGPDFKPQNLKKKNKVKCPGRGYIQGIYRDVSFTPLLCLV
jgi:hypothetical protein